jgi:hypothetical protein
MFSGFQTSKRADGKGGFGYFYDLTGKSPSACLPFAIAVWTLMPTFGQSCRNRRGAFLKSGANRD